MNNLEHIANNGTDTTKHTDVYNAQFWARRAPSVDAQWSHIALVAQGLALCHSMSSMHAHLCVVSWVVSPHPSIYIQFLFHLYLMSNSAPDEFSIEDPLRNSSLGSMVTLDYVTHLTGFEPKEMELTDAEDLNLATSSDIYFQNTLDDTASFPNDPDVDDNELLEFFAVVVDRTGKLVKVRSNNDQFSCDIRNLKSAQSQFPLVTQPEMICQTGRSVQERIAEERESSNAQMRTMLDEQRRTIIAECTEKVLHHELLAAQAEQDRKYCKKNYCDNNRIFVKFISKISWNKDLHKF